MCAVCKRRHAESGGVEAHRLRRIGGEDDREQHHRRTLDTAEGLDLLPADVAQRLEHADEWPADIVAGMREMGLFGCIIREEYGGLGESLLTYALCVEEIARGWMSVSGIICKKMA